MIQNSGFETGDLSEWAFVGDVSVQTESFGTKPKQGSYQALLTTFDSIYEGRKPWEPALPLSGNDPVGVAAIETFLGLPAHFLATLSRYRSEGGLWGVVAGSAIKQQFHAEAGARLTFHYNFLTDGGWGNANDFAFVSLISDRAILGFIISGVEAPDKKSNTVLEKETGYQKFKLHIPFDDQYTLGLGIIEMRDRITGSAICIDKIAVN